MQRLGGLADQMTPVLTDLDAAAPQINQVIKQLGPFSAAATPALTSLGDAADVGDQALIKAKPIAGDLRDFAGQAKPTVQNLDALLSSLKSTGGIERLMDFLYFSAASTNGYDSLGHYLRAVFVLTSCTTYSTDAHARLLGELREARARPPPARARAPTVRRHRARRGPPRTRRSPASASRGPAGMTGRASTAVAQTAPAPQRPRRAPHAATPSAASSPSAPGATQTLLDYLLGG